MDMKKIREKIRSMDRKIIYGAAVGVALAVLVAGYGLSGKDESHANAVKQEAPVSVSAMSVEPATIDEVMAAVGVLNSKNRSVLSSKIMGKVAALTVQEGDQVSRGKLLIRIESGETAAQVYQAEAAYQNAKLQYDRIKRLYDDQAATQVEMDQVTLALESARAGLNAARTMESYTTITAPISGQIVEKRINLGEMAMPGQPILKIEDNRNLRLEVTMKEQDIPFMHPGKKVMVRIDALPDREINGKVTQVVPAADTRTHSFTVKIDIPAEKGLITGMYGKAYFSKGKRQAILVPRRAVVETAGLTGVYVLSNQGTAAFQMVQLGEVRGERVEAITGLKPGDRLIVDKEDGKIDGRKVIVGLKHE